MADPLRIPPPSAPPRGSSSSMQPLPLLSSTTTRVRARSPQPLRLCVAPSLVSLSPWPGARASAGAATGPDYLLPQLAEAPLLHPSSAPTPSPDRPAPVVIHATKPRPCPAFHRLAGDLLHTGSSLDDPSPTSPFDSSSDPEVLVVPLPCCVLHRSSPTDAFVQSPRKGDDQQHKPHRATAKTCLIDEGPAQAGKTDYTKLPNTFMHGCIKTASDIAKYTTDKTT
ncbi:hypothetical protein TRIUR3_26733 [Triticum urartu]|uniref:Uncharacterized protein n=1 Tax=Triticum urartu TaxID=4572 RepID=M8AB98_TRIUA|nr:hypothetical protein TRIUR3_26733 [Triticum urartu]